MLTYFLALVMGWYLLIMGVLLLFRQEVVTSAMRQLMDQRGSLLLAGAMTLIIGLLLVVSHNYWVMGWPVVVTIMSWLILVGGLIRVFSPDCVYKMWGKVLANPNILMITGAIVLIIGLFLLYHGYFG